MPRCRSASSPTPGVPRRLGRQLRYARNTEYFAEAARQFVASGATLVGGCCGTTPAHIRAVARAVKASAAEPGRHGTSPRLHAAPSHPSPCPPKPGPEPPAGWPHQGRFVVVAGVRAPRGQDISQFTAHAARLVSAGADLLAITGQETSAARVSPVAAAAVLRERAGADVIVNMETAGRSLAALQADLLGGYALGVQTRGVPERNAVGGRRLPGPVLARRRRFGPAHRRAGGPERGSRLARRSPLPTGPAS